MSLEVAQARVDLGFMDRIRNTMRNPDLRPAWKAFRKPLRADMTARARKQQGPDGTWPARSAKTRVRAASGRRARRMLGRLPGAVTTKFERRRMLVNSIVRWANAHRNGERVGHGARLPRRDWLYASDQALAIGADIIAKGLAFLIEVG